MKFLKSAILSTAMIFGATQASQAATVAVGYSYEVSAGALFTSITAPSFLTVADVDGYIISDGVTQARIASSQTLFFLDVFGVSGLSNFTLTDIDTALMLDPSDAASLPLAVTFQNFSALSEIEITPITENVGQNPSPVPLPASWLLYLGALPIGRRYLRRS